MSPDMTLFLIAPNVSQQMGGEAMKALQIFQELSKLHPRTVQITHARCRDEVTRLGLAQVEFVEDTPLAIFLWRSSILRFFVDVWFSWKAVRLAESLAKGQGGRATVVFQTEPNSPVARRSLAAGHLNVFGPINGNIYYPAIFRDKERRSVRFRRLAHMPLQKLNRLLPGGIKKADQILVAGGERTLVSLREAGCPPTILRETVDCGISDPLLDRPRVTHQGVNHRFIHFGRLVFHKGTRLIIQSLPKTRLLVCLDVVGRGPELEHCKRLVDELGLGERVRFLDWYTAHEDLFKSFSNYRGMVLPSLEDANGIVVQEAMALGLPPICLDWGGPALLVENGISGFLVKPDSIEHITTELARAMDTLAGDGALAESMSLAGRASAEQARWSRVAAAWLGAMPTVPTSRP